MAVDQLAVVQHLVCKPSKRNITGVCMYIDIIHVHVYTCACNDWLSVFYMLVNVILIVYHHTLISSCISYICMYIWLYAHEQSALSKERLVSVLELVMCSIEASKLRYEGVTYTVRVYICIYMYIRACICLCIHACIMYMYVA